MKILCENKSLKFEKNLAPNSGETIKKERKKKRGQCPKKRFSSRLIISELCSLDQKVFQFYGGKYWTSFSLQKTESSVQFNRQTR